MRFVRYINTIDTHTEGEPTRIITGGLPVISGNTMREKKRYMKKNLDNVRTAVMNEPRGHHNMFGAILTEYVSEDADLGLIFMDGDDYLNFCGHSSIAALTVAIETGIVPPVKPFTKTTIDTPIGQIKAAAKINEEGEIEYVSITGIPAFVFARNIKIRTENYGEISLDIAFGGSFVALVNTENLDLKLTRENAEELIALGMEIKDKANQVVQVTHPIYGKTGGIDITELHQRISPDSQHYLNVGIFGHKQLDRCPCGTGICAMMANLYEAGTLDIKEDFILESVIGTSFKGRILDVTTIGDTKGIIPQLRGSAFITGFNQIVIDPDDPVKFGFRLG